MSGKMILVKITDNYDDLVELGLQLANNIAAKCNAEEHNGVVQIDDSYYVILERTDCIDELISSRSLEYIDGNIYEEIFMIQPERIINIEFDDLSTSETNGCQLL